MIMKTKMRRLFWLFCLAEIIVFSFITTLQFVEDWLFVLALVLMHGGIIIFIVTKKKYHQIGINVQKYYYRTYAILAMYLPILFTKLIYRFLDQPLKEDVITIVTMLITVVAVGIASVNSWYLAKKLIKEMKKES